MNIEVHRYGDVILWEIPIQVVASLFLQAGKDVVDVGSNTGGLAVALGRQVQPNGRMLAIEPNPRMAEWTMRNFEMNGIPALTIQKACYREAGKMLSFYADTTQLAVSSSIYYSSFANEQITVATTTVDEECERAGISPAVIKIDVEGAETDVLDGAVSTLERCAPVVIFERQRDLPVDRDPIAWFQGKKYVLFEVNNLRRIGETSPVQTYAENYFAIPEHLAQTIIYGSPVPGSVIDQNTATIQIGRAGIHVFNVDMAAQSHDRAQLSVYNGAGERVLYYDSTGSHIASKSCSVFPLRSAGEETMKIVTEGAITIRSVSANSVQVSIQERREGA